MALKTPAIDGEMRELLALAQKQVEETIRALGETTRRLEDNPGGAAAEIRKETRLLSGAIQLLAIEKTKIENRIKEHEGIAGGYAIDLAAARAEVRHRLACLRRAAAGGQIPE